jgi:hypothetical protein
MAPAGGVALRGLGRGRHVTGGDGAEMAGKVESRTRRLHIVPRFCKIPHVLPPRHHSDPRILPCRKRR